MEESECAKGVQNTGTLWSNFLFYGRKLLCLKSSPPELSADELCTSEIFQNEIPLDNGYCLGGIVIPEPILELILYNVPEENILSCNLVCKAWNDVITRNHFWQKRFEYKGANWDEIPAPVRNDPYAWMVLYSHLRCRILSKNFIENPSGQSGLDGWTTWDNVGKGHGWRVKESPITYNSISKASLFVGNNIVYFDNLNDWCSKYYIVDLWKEGLPPAIMKLILPFQIKCSQMYAAKCYDFEGVGLFRWELRLLNSQEKIVAAYTTSMELLRRFEWRNAEHSFNFRSVDFDLLEDVRYVVFIHGGDQLYYGIKLTRSYITVECLDKEPEANFVEQPAELERGGAEAIEAAWPTSSVNGWTELGRMAFK